MTLLITPRGEPAPPADVERCLRAISSRLSLKWLGVGGGAWAVMCEWSKDGGPNGQGDARWQTVRQGLTRPEDARDVLCYLPKDCSPEEAASYFEKACYRGEGGTTQQEVRDTLAKVRAWNAEQHLRNAQATMDYAAEIAPTFARGIDEDLGVKGHIRVAQREPGKRKHLLPPDRAPGEL